MDPFDPFGRAERHQLQVDGELFQVERDPIQPGTTHYTRLTGPAPGYGFTARRSDHGASTSADDVQQVRTFLAMLDPVTGYIEDSDDEDGDDGDGEVDG